MNERSLGKNGIKIGEIGLGTWQLGGDWGKISDSEALAILERAAAEGVNFFDTADVYGGGRSEELIGKFLKQSDRRIYVATKLGRFFDPGGAENYTLKSMRKHTEASLKRLGVEALDLTQLHCVPTEVLKRGEVFEHLRVLRKEGKILRFGASVETLDEALFCLRQDGLVSLQIIFNIFRQKLIAGLFSRAKEYGVGLIVRLPLASGLLSGKFTKDTVFDEADHRNYNRDGEKFNVGETFAGLPFEKGVELADQLKSRVPKGMTLAETALRWCLDFDAVSVVIPGAKSPEQVEANVKAAGFPRLPDDMHASLRVFYEREVHTHIRGPY